ncbi:hypothetical protein Q5P01_012224 [Channa striata]|uniref:TRIM8/14/16/25/29/45/65 coiled-coil region domain-containing protein n=1 Tax=Channa striata TaxID=64152 RepID=A0AA88MRY9_CHASR|nr:hypothetical protein Q5P01_012224 [Channa striata]
MDEHKGHDTVSAAAERQEKQKQFVKKTQRYRQGLQEKEKQLQKLQKKIKAVKCCVDAAVDENQKAHDEFVQMADKRRCAVEQLIRSQEKAAMSRGEALVDRLEKEICELRKGEEEIKKLSLIEDHIYFLQTAHSIFDPKEPDVSNDFNLLLHTPFDFVTKAISDLRDKMTTMVKSTAEMFETIQIDRDPQTRQEFLLYSCHLSLDPNTAFENLLLSEGNSK